MPVISPLAVLSAMSPAYAQPPRRFEAPQPEAVEADVEINPSAKDQVPVEADGTFRIDDVFGRRAFTLLRLSPDWRLHSILQGRSEVTSGIDVPLDTTVEVTIVLTRR